MQEPTLTLTPADAASIGAIIASLPDGGVLCLSPGTYHVNLWIERSITLRGSGRGEVILDGGGRSSTVQVVKSQARVTLERLTCRHGAGGAGNGGNLSVFAAEQVTVSDVDLIGGTAEAGGGLFVRGGVALLERCRILGNQGDLAQAVWVYQSAALVLRDCLVAGNGGPGPVVTAAWQSRLSLERCTVISQGTAALRAVGSGSQAPEIVASSSVLGDPPCEVLRGGAPQPIIRLRDCALSRPVTDEGIIDEGGNQHGDLGLDSCGRNQGVAPAPILLHRGATQS